MSTQHKTYLPYLTNAEVAEAVRQQRVLILPLGTVESNGPHQLLGCDFIISEQLASQVVERTSALRMPTFHYGISEFHSGLPGTFTLPEALYAQMLDTLMREAHRNGFERVLLLNCHRHNHQTIEVLGRTLRREIGMALSVIDPLEVVREIAKDQFADDPPGAIGHGGEPLVSLIAHLNPDEIRLDLAPPPGAADFQGLPHRGSARFRFQGANVGLFPLAEEINPSGGWVDLSHTNAQRGRVAFERLCDYTVSFVQAFSCMPTQISA